MRKRVCIVTTTPFIANAFLRPHLLALAACYETTLAVNLHDPYPLDAEIARAVTVQHVPIERKVNPLADLRALGNLVGVCRKGGFHLVHSVSPKAGLLGMAAARLASVGVRIHTFQGEVWAAKRGAGRRVLKAIDTAVARLATHALVVSQGERRFLDEEGVLPATRSNVLGHGSISGVDLERFRPNPQARTEVRAELGIPAGELVIMYVGRITRDKGVLDLARAFGGLAANAWLALVGPDEDQLADDIRRECGERREKTRLLGYTTVPERFMAAADIICLPSYREGFGLVLLEAGACCLPVVASRIYGTQDAVVDGVTGLLHEPGSANDLRRSLEVLASDSEMRVRMGNAGRRRAEQCFQTRGLVQEMLDFYGRVLAA